LDRAGQEQRGITDSSQVRGCLAHPGLKRALSVCFEKTWRGAVSPSRRLNQLPLTVRTSCTQECPWTEIVHTVIGFSWNHPLKQVVSGKLGRTEKSIQPIESAFIVTARFPSDIVETQEQTWENNELCCCLSVGQLSGWLKRFASDGAGQIGQ